MAARRRGRAQGRAAPRVEAPEEAVSGQAVTVVPTQAYSRERAERAYMADLRPPRSTLTEERVADASMIMTIDRARIVGRAGRVSRDALERIDDALAIHLGLTQT